MRRPSIRVLELTGSPGAIGHAHGRAHAHEIRDYTADRVDLVTSGLWSGGTLTRGDVLDIAAACLPAHEAFAPAIHEEMMATADGAGISAAEAIVVGGFTDFVDTVRAVRGGDHPASVIEDDCTAFIVPDDRADGAGFLGQTWDMHDTATDHVVLLRISPDDAPATLVFSTVGCVGQIGMNELGVCVGINNLVAADGRLGVTWPSVVRQMLGQESAAAALDVLLTSVLAGAHNYLIFDAAGSGYNVEAMPTARPVTELGPEPIVHTNHAIDASAVAMEAERDPVLRASSRQRLELATEVLSSTDEVDTDLVMALTRQPVICQRATEPFHVESSGAAIMRPRAGDFWACWGRPEDNDYEHLALVGVGDG